MSYQNSNLPIQQFADNYGNINRTYNVFPYVQKTSMENNKVRLDPTTFLKAGGKLRQVKLTYWPILCDTEGSCDTTICSAGERVEPKQIMFTIGECTASKVYSIDKDDIRKLDNNTWDFTETAKQIIGSAMPDMRRVLALDMLTKLYTMAGVHPDGNSTHRVSVTNPATGVVNLAGKVQVETEYNDAGFSLPNLLGGHEVNLWKRMVDIGGLNASGQIVSGQDTSNAWYDNNLSETILNDATNGGWILAVAPETFKYVWYLENAGIFSTDLQRLDDLGLIYSRGMEGFIEGQMVDPITGIPWDLYINYDKCNQEWTFQIKHRWDFFVMPDVACNAEGVNGIMKYRTCPEVIATCPTGDTPSPALSQTTYSWTPGDIFPFYAATSLIGGVENAPATLVSNIAGLAAMMNDNYVGGASLFTVNGSDIDYDGYTALSGNINGTITITFA